jgi:hypothetical protein
MAVVSASGAGAYTVSFRDKAKTKIAASVMALASMISPVTRRARWDELEMSIDDFMQSIVALRDTARQTPACRATVAHRWF